MVLSVAAPESALDGTAAVINRSLSIRIVAFELAGMTQQAEEQTMIRRLVRRPAIAALVVLASLAGALLVLRSSRGSARSAPAALTVGRGDIIVSVGGVGRIIDRRAVGSSALAASVGAGTPSGSGAAAASAPPGSVFARTSGSIARLLVKPGAQVRAGQPVAVLDDRGLAAAAVHQSETELATSRVELRQKQISDPLKGLPPTSVELAAARAAIDAARARLVRLLADPRPADLASARLEVGRALADREALRGGTLAARRRAIALARRAVELSAERRNRLLAPPQPADVSAASADVKKAEAELAALQAPPPAPSPEALAAAQQAVTTAQSKVAAAQAAGVPADLSAAQLELAKAIAELAALKQLPPPPPQAALASAQQTLDAARAKLARTLAPALPVDLTAARLDEERARSELAALLAGPNPAALAAAAEAVGSAKAKLAQLLGPPLRADLAATRADLRRSQADLVVLRGRGAPAAPLEIELARLKVRSALDRLTLARFARGLLVVRSPVGGTVTGVLVARGAPVDVATPIVSVADLRRLAVGVDLNEFDIARVRKGLAALVRVDALGGRAFAGRVAYVSPTGSNSGGVVTFAVTVELAAPESLRAGMNVSVRVIVKEHRGVVSIPLGAVSRNASGEDVVTVLDRSGASSTRRVTLGLTSTDHAEVLKGLASGERIVAPDGSGGGAAGG